MSAFPDGSDPFMQASASTVVAHGAMEAVYECKSRHEVTPSPPRSAALSQVPVCSWCTAARLYRLVRKRRMCAKRLQGWAALSYSLCAWTPRELAGVVTVAIANNRRQAIWKLAESDGKVPESMRH